RRHSDRCLLAAGQTASERVPARTGRFALSRTQLMRVETRSIPVSEKGDLWAYLQDYIDEMRAFDEGIERVGGVYQYKWFDHYWNGEKRWPFWAVADGTRAGFALLRREESGEMEMAEFYIRPDSRRGGVGLAFARALLSKFSGPWLISEYRANEVA